MKIGLEVEKSYKHKLMTENNFYLPQANKEVISRWSGQQFYLKIKQKIHQKIRTEPFQLQKFSKLHPFSGLIGKNNKTSNKSKSKLVINTLQLALQPAYNKTVNNLQVKAQKCIHTKIQEQKSSLKKVYNRPNKSAKVIRTQIYSPQKQKVYPSCRLNYNPLDQSNTSQIMRPINQKYSCQRLKQKIVQTRHLKFNKIKSESHLRGPKLKKMDKVQDGNTCKNNVFLFYFESRNNMKISSRQKNITKIRRKSKTIYSMK